MLDRQKFTIGLITSLVTIFIYLNQHKCSWPVITLSLAVTFFISLKRNDQKGNK